MDRPARAGGAVTPLPQQGRQVDVGKVITRYRDRLGETEQALIITQASLEGAEAEIAELHARIAELEGDSETEATAE